MGSPAGNASTRLGTSRLCCASGTCIGGFRFSLARYGRRHNHGALWQWLGALALYFLLEGVTAKTVTFGVFLAIDALAILALAIVSSAPKPLMAMVLFRSSGRFMLAAAVQFGAGQPVNMTAGSFGLITGVVAIYGGLALLWEDVKQSSVLPVFRRSSAKRSLEGSLDDQLRRLDHEAGVRQQL
jgi:succinate-acetate transporter protein